jgi:hypothetical protein
MSQPKLLYNYNVLIKTLKKEKEAKTQLFHRLTKNSLNSEQTEERYFKAVDLSHSPFHLSPGLLEVSLC